MPFYPQIEEVWLKNRICYIGVSDVPNFEFNIQNAGIAVHDVMSIVTRTGVRSLSVGQHVIQ